MSVHASLQSWISSQWQKRGVWAWLTWPLSFLYGLIAKHRRHAYETGAKKPYRASVPVIVIGNIYVGGTGKTPLACEIGELLREQGWRPGLVSRGYGRNKDTTLAIGQGDQLDWRKFGDEPALIAQKTGMPISVHRDRGIAAKALLEKFPQTNIIISDDGLQHYRLARDFEILVQDERGVGNGFLLPAGPLREPVARRDEVNLVLTRRSLKVADTEPGFELGITHFWQPATNQKLDPRAFAAVADTQQPIAAVAAIGVPQRFFNSLKALGVSVTQTFGLPDHAPIDLEWLKRLPAKTILITEKDAVKLQWPIEDKRLWIAQTSVLWWCDDAKTLLLHKLAAADIKNPLEA